MNTLFKSNDFEPVHESGANIKAKGYAAKHSFSNLKPFEFERSAPVGSEVEIEVLFCGVCHSDIHQVKNATVPEKHDINLFIELLKRDATICVVVCLAPLEPDNNMQVAMHRKAVVGSLIGNLADTHEVLEFCAEHSIGPDVELIKIDDINDAYDKVEKGDVPRRKSSLTPSPWCQA
jgi:D-arabinose 1-dehydrogenase-like Zn-dependent alcohol dehydrogenase